MTAPSIPPKPLEFPSYLRAVRYLTEKLGSRRAAEERVIALIEDRGIRLVPKKNGKSK